MIKFLPLCIPASFWSNPQYRIQIAGEYSGRDDEKNLLVSLMQKPDKRNRRMVQNLYIGFIVFEVNVTLHCSSHSAMPTVDISCIEKGGSCLKYSL